MTTLELIAPSPDFCTTLAEGYMACVRYGVCLSSKDGESSIESGLEPGTIWLQSRNHTTRPHILFSFQKLRPYNCGALTMNLIYLYLVHGNALMFESRRSKLRV
ncbi:hypothetical protein AVEN_164515-1 [Araneus ventricosus]|uniref:Uncharacterized protein n=1 Tax=Araneus ventricosus TaxID=182803 RepID=A0A4Y2B4T8_ARAVE|nr:hypothetical protein AVEN_164515-1 [Araneus ventricosus]